MPVTINIPNSDNTKTTTTPVAQAPVVNSAPQMQPRSQQPNPMNNSFQGQNNNGNGSNGSDSWWNQPGGVIDTGNNGTNKRLTPQERVELIEKLFQELLGRKADTRDINYYKYSTLSEEEMRKQLITGKEHKQLITDGREFSKMRDRANQAETRVKILEGQIKDQVQEFKHLSELLDEKNKHIQELRIKLNNPYNLIDHSKEVAVKSNTDQYRDTPIAPANNTDVQQPTQAQPVASFQAPTPDVQPIIPPVKKSMTFVQFLSNKIKEILP